MLSLLDDYANPPSILVAADSNSTIQLMFNGNFSLAHFNLQTLIEKDETQESRRILADTIRIKKVKLSSDWSEMGVLASV